MASLLANFALGIVNFVLQPIWRAASVAAAVAITKTKAEFDESEALAAARAKAKIRERKAVAAANEKARNKQRQAVKLAKTKEKAKGRVRRVAVAVPFVGAATAAAFEYWAYSEWKEENPDGDIREYTAETIEISKQVVDEVIDELPEVLKPDPKKLIATYDWIIESIAESALEGWRMPDFPSNWPDW